MDLLIGTTNQGKLRELRQLLDSAPVRLLSLSDVGLATLDVPENHDTYEGNARDKAIAYARASGMPALADDTGLEVDALGGRPGVHSARYAQGADQNRYIKLLGELEGVPDAQRTARFVCVFVVAQPNSDDLLSVRGVVEGMIAHQPILGAEGFGYDSVFIPQGYSTSLATLPLEEKNSISHRGDAARKLIPLLSNLGQG